MCWPAAAMRATPLLDNPFPAARSHLRHSTRRRLSSSPSALLGCRLCFSFLPAPLWTSVSRATHRGNRYMPTAKNSTPKKTNTGRAAEQRSAVPCGKSEQRSDPQPSDPCLGAHRILTPCPAVVKRGTPDRLRWFSTAHMPNGLACGGFPTMPFKTRRVDRWPSRIGPGNALTLLDPDCLSLRLQQAMPETMFTVHLPCSTMPQMHTAEIIIHYHAGL